MPSIQTIINFFKYRFNLDEDKANEDEIVLSIRSGIEFKGTNLWTLIFAIFIASIGLNVNSTAVIIGAMLISPIMGPVMGIGLGAGILDLQLIKLAIKNLAIAALISIMASTVYFFISPLRAAQPELLARTSPTIWDVLIAFFGGLAGIVASSRKKFSNVIPGVAIATALMPPLCTAGYGLATGNIGYFIGAFYLFIINSVFISIATFIMVRFLKFSFITYANKILGKKIQKWIGLIALLTILPSIYMAYRFVQEEFFKQKVQNFIVNEINTKGIIVVNKQIEALQEKATLYVLGTHLTDSSINKIADKKTAYGLDKASVEIINSSGDKQKSINLKELKTGIVEDLFKKQEEELKSKSLELEQLKQQVNAGAEKEQTEQKVVKEFNAIFGEQDEIFMATSLLYKKNNITDTIAFLYVKPASRKKRIDLTKAEKWLRVRLNMSNAKVCIEK